jgi:hypothetical protein
MERKKQLDMKLFGIQFNDKVLVAIQSEIFNQNGKEMLEPFADKNPILVSIANEYVSYIPTDGERKKGGYEPSVSIVKPGSPDLLVEATHKLLGRIYGN